MPITLDQHCARCGHRMFVDALDGRGRFVEFACLRCGSRRYHDAVSGKLQLPDGGGLRRGQHVRKAEPAALVTVRVQRFRERERERVTTRRSA